MRVAALVCVLVATCMLQADPACAALMVTPNMATFGTAIKAGTLPANEEMTVYKFNSGPGVVTWQWFTGMGVMDQDTRVRMYIDGETVASLDFMLFLAHGVGQNESVEQQYIPWNAGNRLAHAADGGIYNTIRVPFTQSLDVTLEHPTGGTFWYIIRGVTNYPLIVGDLQLPSNARLRLYKNENVLLTPLEYLTLYNTTTSTAGALYMVTLAGKSTDFNYLEACFRAYIDGATTPLWLSSGTEDYFGSAYYFDRGVFHQPNSGLTFTDGSTTMTAYKIHEQDPILFTKNFALVWRCGEDGACPNTFPPNENDGAYIRRPLLNNTVVTTYTWVYEYSF